MAGGSWRGSTASTPPPAAARASCSPWSSGSTSTPTTAPAGSGAFPMRTAPSPDRPPGAPAFAVKGPTWISIELPVNPYDKSTRDAFLLVPSFHHGTAMGFIVTGTAEGVVNGERRSLKLDFAGTSREGVYALKRTWPTEGPG